MPWWGWIIVGLILMFGELLAVDAAFYLVFVGIAAVVTGFALAAVPTLGVALQWGIFALLAIIAMVFFRQRVYVKFRGGAMGFADPALGALVLIEEELAPGATARVAHRGSVWTAKNIGSQPIAAGSEARITKSAGLELHVTSEPG